MLFRVETIKILCYMDAHTYYEGRHYLVKKYPNKEIGIHVVNDIKEILEKYPDALLIKVPHIRSMDSISHEERDRIYEAAKTIPFQEEYSGLRYRK